MEEWFECRFKVIYILYEGKDNFKIVQTSKKFLQFAHEPDGHEEFHKVSVSGVMPDVRDGDLIHAYGKWTYSKKYGWGIEAEGCVLEIPSNLNGIKSFLCRFCRGIGEQTAQKIIDKFGEDAIAVITQDYQRLMEIPRISEKKAKVIHHAVQKHKCMEDLSVFLFSHGCSSYNEVLAIYKAMGERALDTIMSNPYSICRKVGLSKFPLADRIALSSGYDTNGKERLKNMIIFFLAYREKTQGDMFVWIQQFPEQLRRYLKQNSVPQSDILFDSERFMACLAELQQEELIILAKAQEQDASCVYLKKNYDCEVEMAALAAAIGFASPAVYKDFDRFAEEFQQKNRIEFSKAQIEAIYKAVSYKLSLITGGPGTGKTETVRGIVACVSYMNADVKIALVSPTGRASKRMTEVTGERAMTIHRFLNVSPENPHGNTEELEEVDYVICDEASMISSELFYLLMKAVAQSDAHLVFVGDVNQLPPVGAGLPFKDLLNSGTIPTTVLSTLFRQDELSLININANKVLAGNCNLELRKNRIDFNFFQLEHQDAIKQVMLKCFMGIMNNMGYSPRDIIVLSPMNKTLLGVIELNHFLQPYFNQEGIKRETSFRSAGYTIYENDRVMQTSNNYALDVFNGDIGYVQSIHKEEGKVVVEFDDVELRDGQAVPAKRCVTYDMDNSEEQDLVLSYACTVHKAQGCEFPVVFMPVDFMLVNLSKTLIYTAMTRARDCFAFLGDYRALCAGIKKNEVLKRNTQFGVYLTTAYRHALEEQNPIDLAWQQVGPIARTFHLTRTGGGKTNGKTKGIANR